MPMSMKGIKKFSRLFVINIIFETFIKTEGKLAQRIFLTIEKFYIMVIVFILNILCEKKHLFLG